LTSAGIPNELIEIGKEARAANQYAHPPGTHVTKENTVSVERVLSQVELLAAIWTTA